MGRWVGLTNCQGALTKKIISCPLLEIKPPPPPIVQTIPNQYSYYDESCERGNEPLDSTKLLVKQDCCRELVGYLLLG
jgi:hypothetical protein